MRPPIRQIAVALALAVGLVAGCGVPVSLRTAPAAVDACDEALQAGVLVESAKSGLAIQPVVGKADVVEVVWPFGYSANRDASGALTLLDPAGKVIAHEGETITLGGGLDANGVWKACAGTVETAPGI